MPLKPNKKYYGLVAGLPGLDLEKPGNAEMGNLTLHLKEMLAEKDFDLLRCAYYPIDNQNLIALLQDEKAEIHPLGNFTRENYLEIIHKKSDAIPYLTDMVFDAENEMRQHELNLYAAYRQYALKMDNTLLREWIHLHDGLNAMRLRTLEERMSKDFSDEYFVGMSSRQPLRKEGPERLSETGYQTELTAILQIHEAALLEKTLDEFYWNWLEEKLFLKTFSLEKLMVYAWQQQMCHRWANLNKEQTVSMLDFMEEIRQDYAS